MLSWTLHQKGSPKHGVHAAVSVRHKLYSFGWNSDEKWMEVQVFNTLSLRWKKLTSRDPLEVPSWRLGHTAVLVGGFIYVWGGYGMKVNYHNVLRAFDVDAHTWSKPRVSGAVPEGRYCHSACVLGKVMFIQGGRSLHTLGGTKDTYKLDTSTMVWSSINTRGTHLPATAWQSATVIGTKMFVFGGLDGGQYYNTIRVFDTETNHWQEGRSGQLLPEERCSHSAFTYNGELYIFGGCNGDQTFNDVWKFSPETFSWKKVEPNGKGHMGWRLFAVALWICAVAGRVILFGGVERWILEDGTDEPTSYGRLYVLDFSPSLKTLCKLAVVQYGLDQSGLPHDIRWELAAMTSSP